MNCRPARDRSLARCLGQVGAACLVDRQRPSWPAAWCGQRPRQAPFQQPAQVPKRPDQEPDLHQRSDELARLEAALFLAREPLPTRKLARLARLTDGTRARTLIRELNMAYDEGGSAFRVESIAGGYQLLTRSPFGPWLRRLLESVPETRLSTAAMETLAIVAYRQPVTRADIESIRGVGSEEMLRHLLERELIAIGGRSDELGRPNVYITTRRFLRVFGLGDIAELPTISLPPAGPGHDSDTPGESFEPRESDADPEDADEDDVD